MKKEFLDELYKIKKQNWNILNQQAKEEWKKSVQLLKQNPFRSLYLLTALFALSLGLKFYSSIIEDKGYEFYKKHPIWIIIIAIIIGVPILILIMKFLSGKYSIGNNTYNQSTTKSSNDKSEYSHFF